MGLCPTGALEGDLIVVLYGGSLEAGPLAAGGFLVRAHFPLP